MTTWNVEAIHPDGATSRATGYTTERAARQQAAHLFIVSDALRVTVLAERAGSCS